MEVGPDQDPDEALTIESYVVEKGGQWAVYVEVAFPDTVRKFRVGLFRSERRAQIQATYVKRYADLPPGFGNMGF